MLFHHTNLLINFLHCSTACFHHNHHQEVSCDWKMQWDSGKSGRENKVRVVVQHYLSVRSKTGCNVIPYNARYLEGQYSLLHSPYSYWFTRCCGLREPATMQPFPVLLSYSEHRGSRFLKKKLVQLYHTAQNHISDNGNLKIISFRNTQRWKTEVTFTFRNGMSCREKHLTVP